MKDVYLIDILKKSTRFGYGGGGILLWGCFFLFTGTGKLASYDVKTDVAKTGQSYKKKNC